MILLNVRFLSYYQQNPKRKINVASFALALYEFQGWSANDMEFIRACPVPPRLWCIQWLYDVGKAHEINDNVLVREESVRPLSI